MIWFEVFLLAIALSLDAFIVSFSCGLMVKKNKKESSYKMAGANGFAQFAMPILGWYGTNSISDYVQAFDHWIVFFVFLALGLKFIKDAMEDKAPSCDIKPKHITLKVLLIASFATSIDAFVAGVTLFFMPVSIWYAALMIGVITFINSLIGFRMTHMFKKIPTKYIEISAGVILITLGTKILLEHLMG